MSKPSFPKCAKIQIVAKIEKHDLEALVVEFYGAVYCELGPADKAFNGQLFETSGPYEWPNHPHYLERDNKERDELRASLKGQEVSHARICDVIDLMIADEFIPRADYQVEVSYQAGYWKSR